MFGLPGIPEFIILFLFSVFICSIAKLLVNLLNR